MELRIPELSFIVLMGASSAGKSTFARQHFKATQIISSDTCQGLVSDAGAAGIILSKNQYYCTFCTT